MNKKLTLKNIFNDDEFGLLEIKPKSSNIKTENERLIESFLEINTFFEKHNREPESNNVTEFKLLARLKALRQDERKIAILKPYDSFNLLSSVEKVQSVSDILADDSLGLLDTDETLSIFKLEHVQSASERAESDFVAQRKAMSNKAFQPYEIQFKQIHKDLKEGKRRLREFKNVEQNLSKGNYYVLDGVLLFLEDDGLEKRILGNTERKDGRTKIIFENGTMSNMYYRSLSKSLYNNGSMVTHTLSQIEEQLINNSYDINEDDVESGWIYILSSKSNNKKISQIKDLYKIGFSRIPVSERLKNASKEPTYLLADVEIIATYRTFNLNVQKFENLIHRFFSEVCLDVDIFDERGRRITPREWFVVPLPIIDEVIKLIISGKITDFSYDQINQVLMKK